MFPANNLSVQHSLLLFASFVHDDYDDFDDYCYDYDYYDYYNDGDDCDHYDWDNFDDYVYIHDSHTQPISSIFLPPSAPCLMNMIIKTTS